MIQTHNFQERKVREVIMHELWDPSTLVADICILKLEEPLELNR